MPLPIVTRPFTLHPETFAWPSFRLHSRRVAVLYCLAAVLVAFLLKNGMKMDWITASLAACGVTAAFIGFAFTRYKMSLRRPGNRMSLSNSVVHLDSEEVRQDFGEGSFLAFKLFAVSGIRELGGFFFISAAGRNTMAVPRNAFASHEESSEFFQRIREAVRSR